jgi:YD repeat-containing protein
MRTPAPSVTQLGAATVETLYDYDGLGNLTDLTLPDGSTRHCGE